MKQECKLLTHIIMMLYVKDLCRFDIPQALRIAAQPNSKCSLFSRTVHLISISNLRTHSNVSMNALLSQGTFSLNSVFLYHRGIGSPGTYIFEIQST